MSDPSVQIVQPPTAGYQRSGAFWAWFIVCSILILYAIATVISIVVPDDVSTPIAVALNVSNWLVSISAGYAVARCKYCNSIRRRSPAGGGPGVV